MGREANSDENSYQNSEEEKKSVKDYWSGVSD